MSPALQGGFLTTGPPGKPPLQYSCLEIPMDGGAWQAIVHGVAESNMTEVTEHTHRLLT